MPPLTPRVADNSLSKILDITSLVTSAVLETSLGQIISRGIRLMTGRSNPLPSHSPPITPEELFWISRTHTTAQRHTFAAQYIGTPFTVSGMLTDIGSIERYPLTKKHVQVTIKIENSRTIFLYFRGKWIERALNLSHFKDEITATGQLSNLGYDYIVLDQCEFHLIAKPE